MCTGAPGTDSKKRPAASTTRKRTAAKAKAARRPCKKPAAASNDYDSKQGELQEPDEPEEPKEPEEAEQGQGEDAQPSSSDLRDRLKTRKFQSIFEALPEVIQGAWHEAQCSQLIIRSYVLCAFVS